MRGRIDTINMYPGSCWGLSEVNSIGHSRLSFTHAYPHARCFSVDTIEATLAYQYRLATHRSTK